MKNCESRIDIQGLSPTDTSPIPSLPDRPEWTRKRSFHLKLVVFRELITKKNLQGNSHGAVLASLLHLDPGSTSRRSYLGYCSSNADQFGEDLRIQLEYSPTFYSFSLILIDIWASVKTLAVSSFSLTNVGDKAPVNKEALIITYPSSVSFDPNILCFVCHFMNITF